ncbi:Pkinase-domain-containing protein [Rhizophagus irregularis]|uniref:Pkinase-domain-containing protein n=2 Tax=Rhizophagus irregularis TaxID=588596 RepID=A0A2I1F2T7_9GLOM|nr:kinase-like domain-containing protein [Rhizophagus irregularis DAOM 181602=DAOM 197198]PKC59222.1 Pkinase-domain-containing protein [Rhizophagus irregularis]PKY28675.1 Pkinase-domain-containing protein [Rhizophagus irregularis]POG58368.1 kinase-like domain-containing protein [Rhizophagus irregularis DAOM 181602=DAOM 197198]|eukprot:XP_025165234.1 kinase-like domain-containing protein [Rhizophagus irregularis DAOM 181602=DAOM 197198]
MHMSYGKTRVAGVPNTRNQRAKLAADYQELLKELSTKNIRSVGNYALEDTLGEGTYGKVKLATHKLTGQKVAIKIIPKLHAENLTREIHHHRYLHHPNIISLLEVIPTETEIYMVLEYCEGGELYDFLVERGRLRENLARKMFGQLCRAVKYCHDRRVVHRDLKLENILLDAYNNIKLGDFGFTRECESKKLLETICGSTGYSAPEMLLAKKYSGLEVDIWSLGVILYTLLCGALPFDDDDENEMKHKIIKGEYEMEEFLSNEAKDLIRSILQLEPSERPTLKQILQHAWFTIKDEEEEYNDDDDDDWATDEMQQVILNDNDKKFF